MINISKTNFLKENADKLATLSDREQLYFRVMWPKSGVLYITSKPGIAKSAIARSIAKKMGFAYQDVRLSMVDETDVGLYPNVSEVEGVKCLDHVVPRWAIEANKRPTIIHFEELNRASLQVRNAALQILLERAIGTNFEFNDTVLMMASGNLGDEDGTDVEEFDSALNNRLVHYQHTLGWQEWVDGFAKDNVHSIITSFIKNNPEKLYQEATENTKAFATPRSWTFLSDFIIQNFGKEASPKEFLPLVTRVANSYIGNTSQRFIQYCEEMVNVTIHDILNRYDDVEKELDKYNRDKNSELINTLKEFDIKTLTEKQLANATKFLKRVGDDELAAYLLHVLDNVPDVVDPKIKKFLVTFKDVLVNIKRLNKPTPNKK